MRFDGRLQQEQPALSGGSRPGYQHAPPKDGADLIGWKIRATFPTGPTQELRWHDGFIIDHLLHTGETPVWRYLFFFPIDGVTEWVRGNELPHPSICFRKAGLAEPRVSPEMVAEAKCG